MGGVVCLEAKTWPPQCRGNLKTMRTHRPGQFNTTGTMGSPTMRGK